MKKYFSFLAVIIITMFISFKKYKRKNTDTIQLSTDKNAIANTIVDEDSSFFVNGSAFFAKFKSPFDVSEDGQVYVTETRNSRSRKAAGNSYNIALNESENLFASDLPDEHMHEMASASHVTPCTIKELKSKAYWRQ